MKFKLNLRHEILKLAHNPDDLTVLGSADLANVFMHIPEEREFDLEELVDMDQLLEKRRQVAVIWCVEDVQNVRPDLDDDQSWAVLQQCRRVHDCEEGFTWLLIEMVADDMFPEASDEEEPS